MVRKVFQCFLCSMLDATFVICCSSCLLRRWPSTISFFITLLVGFRVQCWMLPLSSVAAFVFGGGGLRPPFFNYTSCWVLCSMLDATLVICCSSCLLKGGLRPPYFTNTSCWVLCSMLEATLVICCSSSSEEAAFRHHIC